MDRINFTTPGGEAEALRPTHALQVAAEIGSNDITGSTLAAACETVRSRYRCRTVRTELRRVRLIAETSANDPINISCNDAEALSAFEEARKAA